MNCPLTRRSMRLITCSTLCLITVHSFWSWIRSFVVSPYIRPTTLFPPPMWHAVAFLPVRRGLFGGGGALGSASSVAAVFIGTQVSSRALGCPGNTHGPRSPAWQPETHTGAHWTGAHASHNSQCSWLTYEQNCHSARTFVHTHTHTQTDTHSIDGSLIENRLIPNRSTANQVLLITAADMIQTS